MTTVTVSAGIRLLAAAAAASIDRIVICRIGAQADSFRRAQSFCPGEHCCRQARNRV
ncbi:MAG: hypothetical protein V2A73_10015 [Pseudomonadota bacterium]